MENRKYILDTDIGGDCDECAAIAMLAKCHKEGKIDLLGVTHCTSPLSGAYCAAYILDWYGAGDVPVGQTSREGFMVGEVYEKYATPVMARFLWLKSEGYGTRKFENALPMLRRLLAAETDVTLVFIGPLNNMHELLRSEADEYSPLGGIELVKKSVREVIIMGGDFGDTERGEYNIMCDLTAAAYTAENCPVPITYCGWEAGANVFCGRNLGKAKINNPVRWAYWHYFGEKQMPRESWDPVTVYYALCPEDPNWIISDECAVTFSENRTVISEGCGAKYVRYADEKKLEEILEDMIKE